MPPLYAAGQESGGGEREREAGWRVVPLHDAGQERGGETGRWKELLLVPQVSVFVLSFELQVSVFVLCTMREAVSIRMLTYADKPCQHTYADVC